MWLILRIISAWSVGIAGKAGLVKHARARDQTMTEKHMTEKYPKHAVRTAQPSVHRHLFLRWHCLCVGKHDKRAQVLVAVDHGVTTLKANAAHFPPSDSQVQAARLVVEDN